MALCLDTTAFTMEIFCASAVTGSRILAFEIGRSREKIGFFGFFALSAIPDNSSGDKSISSNGLMSGMPEAFSASATPAGSISMSILRI